MATYTLGSRYVLDESAGLQNGTGGDTDYALAALPALFKTYLDTLGQSYAFAATNGIAKSADGVIQASSGGPISALVLADANNQPLDGDPSGLLTLAGNSVFLYATSDPHIVIGREGALGVPNATGDVVFAVYLETNASNTSATLWSIQYEAIRHPDSASIDEVVDLGNYLHIGAAGDFALDFGTLGSGQLLFGSFGDATIAVIVAGRDQDPAGGIDSINTSQGGGSITIGVDNQMFDPATFDRKTGAVTAPGDAAYFTFVEGLQPASGTTMPSTGANAPGGVSAIDYSALHQAAGASFTIVQIQGAGNTPKTNVQLHAFNTAMEETSAYLTGQGDADDVEVKISTASVKVMLGGVQVTSGITVTQLAGGLGVEVRGVPVGATVQYGTVDAGGLPTSHTRLLIENYDGNPFDIGGFALQGPPTFTAIGQLIGFGDDGPVAAIGLTGQEAITDESTGANAADTGLAAPADEVGHAVSLTAASRLIGWDQATVVSLAGTSAGTDGGSSSVSLELGANTDSGLKTTDGTAIVLSKEGSVVVGRAGTEAIFAISIDANGQITVEQYDSVQHSPVGTFDDVARIAAGRLFAKVSVTDGDSDPISNSVDIGGKVGFEDDGPTASLALNNVTIVVDESVGIDAADPNAHDEVGHGAGVIGWAMLTGDALFTKAKDDGEDEEGATATFSLKIQSALTQLTVSSTHSAISLVADGTTAAKGISADGQYAFRVEIDASSGAVTMIQYLAVDHGNTTSTDELSAALGSGLLYAVWTVTDGDGDKAAPQVDIGSIISIEDDGPAIVTASLENLISGNTPGVTVSGDATFDLGSDAVAHWSIFNAPGDVGTGAAGFRWHYVDSSGDGTPDTNKVVGTLDGVDLYSLFIDSDGSYDFTLLSALKGTDLHLDVTDIKAGGPQTNFIDVGALNSTDYVKISGFFDADGSGPNPRAPAAINESNANVGVVNGNLDANETLAFSLYDSLNNIQDISGISIGTKTARTTSYRYTAFDDGVAVTGMTNVAITVGKNGRIVIDAPAGVLFDSIEITSVNGSAVKIGLGDISIKILPPDYLLGFTLQLTDADTDPVSASFTVGIDGDGDGAISAGITTFAAAQHSLLASATSDGLEMDWAVAAHSAQLF